MFYIFWLKSHSMNFPKHLDSYIINKDFFPKLESK